MSKFEKFIKDEFVNRPMMASEIVAALSEPSRGIKGYIKGKYAKAMARSVQSDIASSQKFVLSNDLIDHVVANAFLKPEAMIGQIKTGIPPFTNMFIEWDDKYLHKAIHNYLGKTFNKELATKKQIDGDYFNLNDEPATKHKNRVGYHIHQVNDTWLYEVWFKDEETGKYAAFPKCLTIQHDQVYSMEKYYSDYEKEKWMMPSDLHDLTRDQMRLAVHTQGMGLWGNHYQTVQSYGESYRRILRSMRKDRDVEFNGTKKLDHLNRRLKTYFKTDESTAKFFDPYYLDLMCRTSTAQGSAMHWLIPESKFQQGWTSEEMSTLTKHTIESISMDVQILISTLAILNYEHIIMKRKRPDTKQIKHIAYGRRVPANEYSLIEIDLPKPRGRLFYEREFTGHGSPKRWHMRRGHWRRYRDAQGHITKRVWIDQCEAGSKELGLKINDYNLQKAKGE